MLLVSLCMVVLQSLMVWQQIYKLTPLFCCVAQTYHPTYSPLVLCDFCPRSYHIFCMGLDWNDLPDGEWACPRCLQQHSRNAVKGVDLEKRRLDAADR